jgi:hypothetical protein
MLRKSFLAELHRQGPRSDAEFFAEYQISKHFKCGSDLGAVEGFVAAFVGAFSKAEASLAQNGKADRRNAWGSWIREVTAIAEKNGLLPGPGKNIDPPEVEPFTARFTPFAKAVWTLQTLFPQQKYACHTATNAAFVKALHRAQSKKI